MGKNKNKKNYLLVLALAVFVFIPRFAHALDMPSKDADADKDGLSDYDEMVIYHTDPNNPDTDGDGYLDGDEVANSYDPNLSGEDRLKKIIQVSLKNQELRYSLGNYMVGDFKISSGIANKPTPTGDFNIKKKMDVVTYKGDDYYYPNTKWNLQFKTGYYIHGAYWHNNFGHPMSHGCINVSYANMEPLYNWADVGTELIISKN